MSFRTQHMKSIFTEVADNNTPAVKLYENLDLKSILGCQLRIKNRQV